MDNAKTIDDTWSVRVTSMVKQEFLVSTRLAWHPTDALTECLVTWEVFGGGLIGNLVTDSSNAELSLWPDTKYRIEVMCKNKVSFVWIKKKLRKKSFENWTRRDFHSHRYFFFFAPFGFDLLRFLYWCNCMHVFVIIFQSILFFLLHELLNSTLLRFYFDSAILLTKINNLRADKNVNANERRFSSKHEIVNLKTKNHCHIIISVLLHEKEENRRKTKSEVPRAQEQERDRTWRRKKWKS